MGGLIRGSIILLSASYVQHCIVMITGTEGVNFCGGVGKIPSITTGGEDPYKGKPWRQEVG